MEKIKPEYSLLTIKNAVDWNDLYGRIPDESLISEFAATFLDSTSKLVEALERSVAENNFGQMESNAHALKGAAANLGAVLLAKAAWQIENAARQQCNADFQELLKSIDTEYARLAELLSHPDWISLVKLS